MSAALPSVVVGGDGSPEAEAALRFAVAEARLRGLPLRIVCAWDPPGSAYVGEAFAATTDAFVAAESHADDVLRAALELVGREGAGVEVEAVAIEGAAASVLLEQAASAELLVVGSRGRGAAKRLLLGSVSHDIAHHAPCPLVIVPPAR